MAPTPSYFVVMCDFPSQRAREATVDPEMTRQNVIDRVASGEYENILFIHEIRMGELPSDITQEILEAAGRCEEVESPLTAQDIIDRHWDHERDLRKHERA